MGRIHGHGPDAAAQDHVVAAVNDLYDADLRVSADQDADAAVLLRNLHRADSGIAPDEDGVFAAA